MAGKGKYKDTLCLPKTDFPMRGGLAKREPEFLAAWDEAKVYEKALEARADSPTYILHDGPPYANNSIHYGHILNKVLKDIVVKYKTMSGFRAPFVPGWDTHGLPIELLVAKQLGKKRRDLSDLEFRKVCREYALKYVDVQREEFKRLGIFGDWDSPYLTLDPTYEVSIIKALAAFARGGYLYRGKKPVHWCPSCATALAEAEIEYADHTSPSIYVRMPLEVEVNLAAVNPRLDGKSLSLIIWTTTPWTIPANLAIVAHRDFEYVAVPAGDDEYWLLAKDLAEATLTAAKREVDPSTWIAISKEGLATLEGQRYHHPLGYQPKGDSDFKFWFADYVTLEAGTGLVHTAPGHGADDYRTGVAHELEPYAPIDQYGKFTADVPAYEGKKWAVANPEIVQALADSGHLINPVGDSVHHSYPHCWRCKKPVLFRATEQWFISIDHAELRQRALVEIEATKWIPSWGENRINGMIAGRPDWVLSRQRLWGVPIPAFYCTKCETVHADSELMERVAKIFAEHGSDAWYEKTPAELLPDEFACTSCGGKDFRTERAIVDVWFESGASWIAMAARSPDYQNIDLYLEGSDQHRGWFHSSLLIGIAVAGRAPYKEVITHGFVLDQFGKKYSKTAIANAQASGKKIKYVAPEEIIKKYGAELLRMWVTSIEYRNDMPYTEAVLSGLTDWVRKLRNTMRFMLGNLGDFDPNQHSLGSATLSEIDRYALARLGDLVARVRTAYGKFEFHIVHRSLVDYVTTELSSFYLDVLKDRLYSDRTDGPRRRAAQAVLHTITRTLAVLCAPSLCFTAEDIWNHLPNLADAPSSIHLASMPEGKRLAEDAPLAVTFEVLLRYRELALAALEPFRAEKHRSEDAEITINAPAVDHAVLTASLSSLPDLFIVSSVVLAEPTNGEPSVAIGEATGERCHRCWRYYAEMSAANEELCNRCEEAVSARGETQA